MKSKKSVLIIAFTLSLTGLFLQPFREGAVTAAFHVIDFLILLAVLADTFLPACEEKYLRKYFKKHWFNCLTAAVFCSVFAFFKLNKNPAYKTEDSLLIFALFKNLFLLAKIIQSGTIKSGFTQKIVSNPAKTLIISFLTVIIAGAFLLMLPVSSQKGSSLCFQDALFTSASAVCVTGLSVIDVSAVLSGTGKLILAVLIQIGGLGIMVFSFFGMLVFRKKLSVADKMTVSYLVSEEDMTGLFKALKIIVFSTFLIEASGAFFLFLGFTRRFGFGVKGLMYACFHSVSAFCNAGFALFTDSLESFTADPLINIVTGCIIFLGGIGFAVIYDVAAKAARGVKGAFGKKRGASFKKDGVHFLSFNTRIVLTMSVFFLTVSFALFYLLEHAESMKDLPLGTQYLASFFQAVTLRTAGFSTVPFSNLRNATLLFMIFVMFVGGASGSTAGGIKLNTVAVAAAFFKSFLHNEKTVIIKNKAIPEEQVKKAFLILGFGVGITCLGIFLLTVTEKLPFLPLVFETVSAFATVGLSTGITGLLSPLGRAVIIFLMFIGRVGPLTILTAAEKKSAGSFEYSYGSINIG